MARKTQLLLLGLLCLWAAAMAWVPRVDFAWTARLTAYRHHPFAVFARRTLFQGELPGATDPAALLALAAAVLYWRAHAAGASRRLRAERPALGFLFSAALLAGWGVVYALKVALGRARPLDVLSRQHLPYTDWYQIGKLPLGSNIFRGSFPSGHTAAVVATLSLAYVLAFDPAAGRRRRAAGAAVALLALAGAGAMTVASAMGGNHWLSDGLGAVGLVWLVVHLLYFQLLDVPGQCRRLRDAPAAADVSDHHRPVLDAPPATAMLDQHRRRLDTPPATAMLDQHRRRLDTPPAPDAAASATHDSAPPPPAPPFPRFWEARLCASGLLVAAGGTLVLLGLRALAAPPPATLGWLLAPGVGLLALGLPRARALLRRVHQLVAAAPAPAAHSGRARQASP